MYPPQRKSVLVEEGAAALIHPLPRLRLTNEMHVNPRTQPTQLPNEGAAPKAVSRIVPPSLGPPAWSEPHQRAWPPLTRDVYRALIAECGRSHGKWKANARRLWQRLHGEHAPEPTKKQLERLANAVTDLEAWGFVVVVGNRRSRLGAGYVFPGLHDAPPPHLVAADGRPFVNYLSHRSPSQDRHAAAERNRRLSSPPHEEPELPPTELPLSLPRYSPPSSEKGGTSPAHLEGGTYRSKQDQISNALPPGGEDAREGEIEELRKRVLVLERQVAELLAERSPISSSTELEELAKEWSKAHEKHGSGGSVNVARVRAALARIRELWDFDEEKALVVLRKSLAMDEPFVPGVKKPLELVAAKSQEWRRQARRAPDPGPELPTLPSSPEDLARYEREGAEAMRALEALK